MHIKSLLSASNDMKAYTIGAAALCVWMILYFLSGTVAIWTHALVNIIDPGRSGSKALFLLIYGLCLCVTYVCCASSSVRAVAKKGYEKTIVWSSVIASFVLSLGLYVFFILKYHLPISYSIVVNNGSLTSIGLLHSHITKGAFAFITQYLPQSVLNNIDSGLSLVGLLPQAAFVAELALVLVAMVGFILLYRSSVYSTKTLQLSRNISFSILYWLSSYMILKSMLDGGIGDASVAPGILFFLILTSTQSKRIVYLIAAISAGAIVLVGGMYIVRYFNGDQDYVYHAYCILVDAALLFIFYLTFKAPHNRLYALSVVLFVIFIFPQAANYSNAWGYLDKQISADGAWLAADRDVDALELLGRIGDIRVYRYAPIFDATAPVRVSDIIAMSGFIPSYEPVSVLYDTCMPHGSAVMTTMVVESAAAPIYLGSTTSLYNVSLVPRREKGTYDATIMLRPCVPMALASYVEILKSLGLSTFFIHNLKDAQNGDSRSAN